MIIMHKEMNIYNNAQRNVQLQQCAKKCAFYSLCSAAAAARPLNPFMAVSIQGSQF